MNRKPISNNLPRSYEDFVPSSSVLQDANAEILVINLPEFKKEQVRVQIDSFGNLKITGERPLVGSVNNKWSRFRKDYRIPSNCHPNEIRAKFENSVLNVTMPKPVLKQEAPAATQPVQNKPVPKQEAPAAPTQPTQKPATESKLPSQSPIPNQISDPIHALYQQMKDKLQTPNPQAPSTSSKPTATTTPTQKPATESNFPSIPPIPNQISDPIHALMQQMKDKLPTSNPQAPSTSSKPTATTTPTQKPATESNFPSIPPIPNQISDPIHALMQQMKDKLPTSNPQAPSTSSKPTETTPTQPTQKPSTESKLPSLPQVPNPISEPIHALMQQIKDKFPTPTSQAPSTSLKPTAATPGPTQPSHQFPTTTNDDKTTYVPHPPPSQVSTTPIPEITHRKKPEYESSNAAQRTHENNEKIAKEKKRKYVDAKEEMKGKKSSTANGDHGNGGGSGRTLEDYIEGLAMELKKPTTQLVVNVVVASMVVVGLITWTLKSTKRT